MKRIASSTQKHNRGIDVVSERSVMCNRRKRPQAIACACLLAVLPFGYSEELNVTISPANTNPTVNYYSNEAGELHSLNVNVAAGYKFQNPPSLMLNPDTLWTKVDSNSFGLADMEGLTQHTAKVAGSIIRIGGEGGGGGGGTAIPFAVNMITRYFVMDFLLPERDTTTLNRYAKADVSVQLANAIGAPGTGYVTFSSNLGNVSGNTIETIGGMAFTKLTVTNAVSTIGTVTANAANVDVTAGEKATGTKSSHELTILGAASPGNPPKSPGKPILTENKDKTQVLVQWEDRSSDEVAFYVERTPNGADWTRLAVLPSNTTSYNDTTVDPETVYFYRIIATK